VSAFLGIYLGKKSSEYTAVVNQLVRDSGSSEHQLCITRDLRHICPPKQCRGYFQHLRAMRCTITVFSAHPGYSPAYRNLDFARRRSPQPLELTAKPVAARPVGRWKGRSELGRRRAGRRLARVYFAPCRLSRPRRSLFIQTAFIGDAGF
jgi:hypothetical protein